MEPCRTETRPVRPRTAEEEDRLLDLLARGLARAISAERRDRVDFVGTQSVTTVVPNDPPGDQE